MPTKKEEDDYLFSIHRLVASITSPPHKYGWIDGDTTCNWRLGDWRLLFTTSGIDIYYLDTKDKAPYLGCFTLSNVVTQMSYCHYVSKEKDSIKYTTEWFRLVNTFVAREEKSSETLPEGSE